MKKSSIDYSLYLVTDSTPAILGSRDLVDVVEESLRGGVSCVQLREKTGTTEEVIALAKRLHWVTQRYGVPLLINDRVDVAKAVECEGVHVGQDDTDLATAREILGPDAIIGVSAGTVEEALRACEGGADYLGIGTVYSTSTKKDTKNILGPKGVSAILDAMATAGHAIPTVCIGGINQSNTQQVLQQSASPSKSLDGVAVVSAIVGASQPQQAAKSLRDLVNSVVAPAHGIRNGHDLDILASINTWGPEVIQTIRAQKPISHNMTNLVVQNFAANVALAIGASPIMSSYAAEAADLANLGGALVINMGTVTPDTLQNHLIALKAYNKAGRPVIFDPVGAGATTVRRNAVKTLMASGFFSVIKGNEGEIKVVYGSGDDTTQQRGVDSSSTLSDAEKAGLVKALAARERTVVVMTGKSDYVSDGMEVYRIDNGHGYLGEVTGTGCVLGTAISAAVAVRPGDLQERLRAAVAVMLQFEIAAELAAGREEVRGPGTFVSAFIDELVRIREGDGEWTGRARVVRVDA
ncbi:hypothetical protein OQA88_396 [Cercophora sp. LCS_1]